MDLRVPIRSGLSEISQVFENKMRQMGIFINVRQEPTHVVISSDQGIQKVLRQCLEYCFECEYIFDVNGDVTAGTHKKRLDLSPDDAIVSMYNKWRIKMSMKE